MGNPSDFQSEDPYRKLVAHYKTFVWDTLEINWSPMLLKLGSTKVTLTTAVTVPLTDKYRVRSIMNNNDLISYIMLLAGVTWQVPYKFNTVAIQDINQSI